MSGEFAPPCGHTATEVVSLRGGGAIGTFCYTCATEGRFYPHPDLDVSGRTTAGYGETDA